MGRLKPYPRMKDSGVPWLGAIPEHWEVRRNGRLFSQRSETGRPDLPILEVSLRTGVRVRDFEGSNRKQIMADLAGYKCAHAGDIVYNTMRMWQGALGVPPVDGLVSPAYVVARPHVGVDSGYYEYLFRTDAYMAEVNAYSRGIVADRNRLYWEAFKQIESVFPPIQEQKAIVRFLDHVGRRVKSYIRAKEKLIKLLAEQTQATTHRTITSGLDPSIRMKPSGSLWLGDVPGHWEVRKLRQCATVIGGMTPNMDTPRFWGGGVPWITPKDVKTPSIGDSIVHVTDVALEETSLRLIEAPAVLMVVRGMILARRVPIAWTTAPVTVNQDMKALSPVDGVDAEYLARQLTCAEGALVPFIDEAGHGTRRLPTERWRDLSVVVPPLHEQREIVRYLNSSTQASRMAIECAEREITRLREYSARLTANLVTGALDVRAVAPDLPNDAETADLLREADVDGESTDDIDSELQEAEA